MGDASAMTVGWVLLTMGDRPTALAAAIDSIRLMRSDVPVCVVVNGADHLPIADNHPDVTVIASEENLGVPGGRDLGVQRMAADLVFFLDDDARIIDEGLMKRSVDHFVDDRALAAISFHLVDEDGATARRHVPRLGRGDADRSGPVATFLGGASVVRRSTYVEAGGYWPELRYGHEELDLSWRMLDCGGTIFYDAESTVFHPRTDIARHADGWFRTGRNRSLVARRNLPWPLHIVHVASWSALGTLRAPGGDARRAFLDGVRAGWRESDVRSPMSWKTVWRLCRLRRPPIL